MPDSDFSMKVGDTASAITATLENSGGTAIDIQGATIRFKMAPIAGGTVTIDDAAVNSQNGNGGDGSTGQVTYNWATTAGTAGFYLAEWEVRYANGSIQTFPNEGYVLIDVTEDL